MKPLCIDLFSGLGGWSEGFLAEGYECRGYDIEAHDYGTGGYPGTLKHGSKSSSRKAASALIAKIPFPLSSHIARCFKPASVSADEKES